MASQRKKQCAICNALFMDKDKLVSHIGKVHKDQIPENWDAARYECYLRTGKTEGKCVVCGKPTEWNPSTGKYHRLCPNPKCKQTLREKAEKNSIGKFGVAHILSDPELGAIQQRKMIYNKSTSGTYVFTDDDGKKYEAMYDSSYGKDFLQMLDVFLNFSGRDIMAPSPHTYEYKYEGKTHYYIPDVYIVSLNLEVELKDGGDNPNNHPKIQKVDKVKERLKDEVMESLRKEVNYIKIQNKNYSGFFALLSKLKSEDIVYLPKWDVEELNIDNATVTEDVSPTMLLNDLPEGVSNNVHWRLKTVSYIHDPEVTYDKIIVILKKRVHQAKTPQQIKQTEEDLLNLSERFAKIANDTDEENSMQDEAIRAKKYIDTKLLPEIQKKKARHKIVSEGLVPYIVMESEDIEEDDKVRIPVFIILSYTGSVMATIIHTVTKEPYSHASIAMDLELMPMYSFNLDPGKNNGFTEEYTDRGIWKNEDCTYNLYAYLATPSQFELFQNLINDVKERRAQYRYNFKGLFSFIGGPDVIRDDHYFCSEFCTFVLKYIDPNTWKKKINQYTPYGLVKGNKNVIHITKGKMRHYNPMKAKTILKEKIKEMGYTWNESKK